MDTKRLHKLIEKKLPGAEVESHALKSGIVQIDVAAKGRSFAIESDPRLASGSRHWISPEAIRSLAAARTRFISTKQRCWSALPRW